MSEFAQEPPSLGPSVSSTKRFSRIALLLLGIVLGGIAAVVIWYFRAQEDSRAEEEARKALSEMGAVVLRDAQREHVQSVTMTLPKVQQRVDEAIPHITRLKYLVHLDLAKTNVTDDHLQQIGKLRRLSSLALNATKISDRGVEAISSLPLESLILRDTPITSAAVETIGSIGTLQMLDLRGTNIDGELAPLSGLNELEWLVLSDVKFTDEAVEELLKMPKLGRITAVGSEISPGSLQRLRDAQKKVELTEAEAVSEPIQPASQP